MRWCDIALLGLTATLIACAESDKKPPVIAMDGPVAEWPEYRGNKAGLGYSPLTQIDVANVDALEPAWIYRHGDIAEGKGDYGKTSFQSTPIVIGRSLYFCTAFNRVIALDAETGAELWSFDPRLRAKKGEGPYPLTCRGVAYWKDPSARETSPCSERIFTGTRDSELIALDAKTGLPCAGFGDQGRVSLRTGIGDAPNWETYPTSPPVVVRDRVVVGTLVADSLRVNAPPGVIRAYDARSGDLSWAWDPVPPGWQKSPAEVGRIYEAGTPNVWSIMSADEERGLVFLPTGNASPDSFAATRRGLDHYASSTVALEAETGRVAWAFQTVHHDVWDYDLPAQPVLFQLTDVGGGRPGVAQITKMGHLFLLDRETGVPLYPVEERPVPASDVPGEILSPTQPFPTHPAPLHPPRLAPEDAWGFTPFDRNYCANLLSQHRNEGLFTPPSLEGSVQFPGSAGGPNWGGIVIDPATSTLYVNQIHTGAIVTLVPRAEFDADNAPLDYPKERYPMTGAPYGVKRMPLLSNFGAPCNPPPWGTLTAVDLASGEVLWKSVLGTTRDQAPWPLWFDHGAPNLGGGLATAGGLLFIGATTDKFFRAFDSSTGDEIWRTRLPFTANSTPMSYRLRSDSRQFVVIAAGGHGWSESGDALIAFALPQ
jgi:quinoprotein glucose dehydrogenase